MRELEIKLAKLEDANAIVDVLNKTTLELHGKGIQQWDYPWDEGKVANQIESEFAYAVWDDGRIIGTFCIHEIDVINELFVVPGSIYLSQIAILPEYQGKNCGAAIVKFVIDYVDKLDKALYLDCWAGNEKLKKFYTENGLENLGDFPEKGYEISIFTYKE